MANDEDDDLKLNGLTVKGKSLSITTNSTGEKLLQISTNGKNIPYRTDITGADL